MSEHEVKGWCHTLAPDVYEKSITPFPIPRREAGLNSQGTGYSTAHGTIVSIPIPGKSDRSIIKITNRKDGRAHCRLSCVHPQIPNIRYFIFKIK